MWADNLISSVAIAWDEKIIKINENVRNYETVAMAYLKLLSHYSAEEPKEADET